jgi:hypothetical protein
LGELSRGVVDHNVLQTEQPCRHAPRSTWTLPAPALLPTPRCCMHMYMHMYMHTRTRAQVASYMRAVLRTLAQCHAHCILHRDIKPGNFMLLTDAEDSPLKAIGASRVACADRPCAPAQRQCVPTQLRGSATSERASPRASLSSLNDTAARVCRASSPPPPSARQTLGWRCFSTRPSCRAQTWGWRALPGTWHPRWVRGGSGVALRVCRTFAARLLHGV